jgi:uncharacterized protein
LRTLRLSTSPHKLALGLAIGVFVATTPLLGLQLLLATGIAWIMRGSIPAAIVGTFWANPLTSPPVWLASYGVGAWLLGADPLVQGRGVPDVLAHLVSDVGRLTLKFNRDALTTLYGTLLPIVQPILQPVLIGSLPIGLILATIVYAVMHRVALSIPQRYTPVA